MTAPTWKPIEGPPPGPPPKAPRALRTPHQDHRPYIAPQAPRQWVNAWDPPAPGTAWPPPKGDTRKCLQREGDSRVTDCGRLVFGVATIGAVTRDPAEVTCDYCLFRIRNGRATVYPDV
jgi:hypothetical protein